MTAEVSNKLCGVSRHGYWTVGGPHPGEFVVFDHESERHAFLLKAWRGRPAYTIMPLEGLDMDATFHDEVITLIANSSHFAPSYSTLGLLRLENGRGLISTIDMDGHPIEVELGEMASVVKDDGEYWFCWGLMLKSTRMKTEQIVFDCNGNDCWLNAWRAPFWEPPEGEEDGGGGLTMQVRGDMIEYVGEESLEQA